MASIEIASDIHWVGAVDWNVRHFHGHTYATKRGTTYNAYLIRDEKITLIDTVFGPFTEEMIEKIRHIVPPEKIDYIVANHVETDHSGALPAILKLCPRAKVFGTAKCKEGLRKHYFEDWDFQVVKTGDKLKLGKRTLTFLEAPMLHWPDSMFTYVDEDALLLPNDAFGQHYATEERFDDEVDQTILMDEATKYYANILWPLSSLVVRKIEQVSKLGIPIKMIAPSHGIIWRKDPMKIINTYLSWGKNETRAKVVIAYETMWGATAKMAAAIVQGLVDSKVETKVYDINQADRTAVISDMLDAKGIVIGSSTHDNDMLANIAGFLHLLKGLKPKNRIGVAFGSYGWAGGAANTIEETLKATGVAIAAPSLAVKYVPSEDELRNCYEYGKELGIQLKSSLERS